MPSTVNTWQSMLAKSSSPCRIATDRPVSSGAGAAPDWSVSQNFESRWLREFNAISTSSSRARSAISAGARDARGTRPNALRMPPALAAVSATSEAGSESRTRVAPAVTFRVPSGATSAVRMTIGESAVGAAGLVAADQREGAGVVAAPLGLVLPGSAGRRSPPGRR